MGGGNQVSWSIKLNSQYKIIELFYSGLVTPDELKGAFEEAISLSKREGIILFLADCTELVGGHTVIDLYLKVAQYASINLREMKEAVILPIHKSSVENVKFYETACLNKGFNVKIFGDTSEAVNWLIEE